MQIFKRIFLIVLDSVGIGELPDAKKYNDSGAHTLKHIAQSYDEFSLPHLQSLGLGNIDPIPNIPPTKHPKAYYTKMKEASVGKDTLTGHWELMGLHLKQSFLTFPKGFPKHLIDELEKRTGRKVIGNKVASGTEIIEELGEEHMNTGAMIVYTSADSVLQIAAHEEIIPVSELYDICSIARELTLQDEFMVGRVIARPFIGELGAFIRTENRQDYAIKPFDRTVMDELKTANYDVVSLGKIADIFAGEGITKAVRTANNDDGVAKLLETMKQDFSGLCFLNLVDFDSLYGHRRDPIGYGQALERFDEQLPMIMAQLKEDDLLIITADHGNDPTHHGTDHTREYVPLLMYHKNLSGPRSLEVRETFADVGATIAENFKVPLPTLGTSMYNKIKQ